MFSQPSTEQGRMDSVLKSVLQRITPGSAVLDYGCLGWKVVQQAKAAGLSFAHHGCDIATPEALPDGARFHRIEPDTATLPFDDDAFELIVATHVLEHVSNPLELFQEWVRVCKPGGIIYIEAPSDRALLCRSDPDVEAHTFLSFWDDPTHRRPWSPAALYRLALSFGCDPLECRYMGTFLDRLSYPLQALMAILRKDSKAATALKWRANQWVSYAIIRKPPERSGLQAYQFVSLEFIAPGKANAMGNGSHPAAGGKAQSVLTDKR